MDPRNEECPRIQTRENSGSDSDVSGSSKNSRTRHLLIINLCNPFSLGGAAIASSLVRLLGSIPSVILTIMPTRPRDALIYAEKYGICSASFIRHFWFREKASKTRTLLASSIPLLLGLSRCLVSKTLRRLRISCRDFFSRYDAIIDLNSDALNEYYGSIYPLFTLINIAMATTSGKPVIICPCSISYFKNPLFRLLARTVLNRVDLIMLREERSRKNLGLLRVAKPKIIVSPDLAFLMEPRRTFRLEKTFEIPLRNRSKNPLVGITPNGIIHNYAFPDEKDSISEKYSKYISIMATITDFAIEKLDANVILIAHSLSEGGELASFSDEDDRIHCKRIYELVRNKKSTRIVKGNYAADEIKWLIGKCDLFIGCRMHSTIASTSMCVPTITVAYGEKFEGVIGDVVGQSSQIVRIDTDHQTFLSQLELVMLRSWERRNEIRKELEKRIGAIKESAQAPVLLIEEILGSFDRE